MQSFTRVLPSDQTPWVEKTRLEASFGADPRELRRQSLRSEAEADLREGGDDADPGAHEHDREGRHGCRLETVGQHSHGRRGAGVRDRVENDPEERVDPVGGQTAQPGKQHGDGEQAGP